MSATSVLVIRPRDHAPQAAGWPAISPICARPHEVLAVMVLANHKAGQVAHCGQADCYGSVTQTIAILCTRSLAEHSAHISHMSLYDHAIPDARPPGRSVSPLSMAPPHPQLGRFGGA